MKSTNIPPYYLLKQIMSLSLTKSEKLQHLQKLGYYQDYYLLMSGQLIKKA